MSIHSITVAAAVSFNADVAIGLELGQDFADSPFCDPDRLRDLDSGAVGPSSDMDEHKRMVGQKAPGRHGRQPPTDL